MIFLNRKHAGELLASKLHKYKDKNMVVLALPRGGVPVAAAIAAEIGAPLDVLVVRKIGVPFNLELAAGALCENEDPVYNNQVLSKAGLTPEDVMEVMQTEKKEIARQVKMYRHGLELIDLSHKTVVLVDDGLATGATVKAAIKFLKKKGVEEIVVAVPVAPTSSARAIRDKVDDFIVLEERENLFSVSQWYKDFSQVSDKDVTELLKLNSKLKKTDYKESKIDMKTKINIQNVDIKINQVQLVGELALTSKNNALIVFVHGSGSSRNSPRNLKVARELNEAGFATLLFDLLTESEGLDRKNVFAINLLSDRLVEVTKWVRQQPDLDKIPIGYFGASTGAAAAIEATAKLIESEKIYSIVSRGGRPDLANDFLKLIKTPTLLLVGARDTEVIELNKKSQKLLSNSKMIIIQGASHLFEEVGTLEEVSQQAVKWFTKHLNVVKAEVRPDRNLEEAISKEMIRITKFDDLDPLIQSIKQARVVMLGEASHGTSEYYRLRSEISKRLIRDHGFKFIAVEGDWPDAYRLDKYLKTGEGVNAKNVLKHNHRWPTWMWANEEILSLAEWLKNKNVGFYGLDVYSLFESMDEISKYLKTNYPKIATEVEKLYSCFAPYEQNEISYARSLAQHLAGCQSEVLQVLEKLLKLRLEEQNKDSDELFSAQQNAHIIANAESYYRSMLEANSSSWNIRDGHMMETLDRLLERSGEGGKAIVWAHNTHIGDYRATDMKANGYINLGGLARLSYGDENVALVGFGSYHGEVLASLAWGGLEKKMVLSPAKEGSYEDFFHKASLKDKVNQFYIIFNEKNRDQFKHKIGHRAIGVVYDADHESRGNYVPTVLSERYNSFIYIDKTSALKSLRTVSVRGEFPETWPSGV